MANITDFVSKLKGGGARANQFKVTLPFPGFAAVGGETESMAFLCSSTQLPAVDYQVDAFVDHLDRNGNTIKSYTFRGMFPKDLQAIELTYAPATELEQFTCTWRYQYWESNTTT